MSAVGAVRVHVVDREQRDVGDAVIRARLDRLAPAGQPVEHRQRTAISTPSSRTRSIAVTSDPPEVTTSSTTSARSPGSIAGPSIQRWRPCSLRSLRTMNAFRSSAAASTEQATGSAPRVGPPTATAPRRRPRPRPARPRRGSPARAQQSPACVDVVLGGPAAGERHLADHEAVCAQPVEEALAGAQGGRLSGDCTAAILARVPCPRLLNTLDPFNLKQQVARLDDVRSLGERFTSNIDAARTARRALLPLPLVDRPEKAQTQHLPAVQGAADPVAAEQAGRPAAVRRQRRMRRRLRRGARARGGGHRAAGDLGLLGLGAVGIDDGRRADRTGDGGPVAQLAARGLPRHPVDAATALRAGRDARLHRASPRARRSRSCSTASCGT